MTSSDPESKKSDIDVEDLLCRLQSEPDRASAESALEALCVEHPEAEVVLRRRWNALIRLGVVQNVEAVGRSLGRVGPYRLLRRIGKGGVGDVFEASEDGLRRTVAVKIMRGELRESPEAAERSRREMAAVGALNHPGIVRLFSFGEEWNVPYLVFERVFGASLGDVLAYVEGIPVPVRRASDLLSAVADLAPQSGSSVVSSSLLGRSTTWTDASVRLGAALVDALIYAHERGVLHRDVKPSNVMIETDGRPKLIDFGLARVEGENRVTFTGRALGTPAYLAPELLDAGPGLADRAADPRVDVYGAGLLLYEMLAGVHPFASSSMAETTRLIAVGAPFLRRLNRTVSRELEAVVMKAVETDPRRRYASAAHLREDLTRYLENRPVSARRPGVTDAVRRFARRRPALAAAYSVFLLAACVATPFAATSFVERRRLQADVELWAARGELTNLLQSADGVWPVSAGEAAVAERWAPRARRALERAEKWKAAAATFAERGRPRSPNDDATDDVEVRRARIATAEAEDHLARMPKGCARSTIRTTREAAALAKRDYQRRFDRVFEDPLDMDRYGAATAIADASIELASVLSRVEAALDAVRADSDPERIKAWVDARRRIEARYGGLLLPSIGGLVPLGPDPESSLEEFYADRTGVPPTRGPDGRLARESEFAVVFVLIPGGVARIGATTPTDAASRPDARNIDPLANAKELETPETTVDLDPFLISKFELTVSQYRRMGELTGRPSPAELAGCWNADARVGFADHPVFGIRFDEAAEASRRLGWTPPTGAQWEYAARAGTTTRYWTGSDPKSLEGAANVADRSWFATADREAYKAPWFDWDDGFAHTAPTGRFRPNPFGLHDVLGNVDEWCRDGVDDRAKNPPRPGDGLQWATPAGGRAALGGAWEYPTFMVRVSRRWNTLPDSRGATGLRPTIKLRSRM
jgi:serine/threonine protein kinase/formylglycine-generating enzyme required for sulfatase activity